MRHNIFEQDCASLKFLFWLLTSLTHLCRPKNQVVNDFLYARLAQLDRALDYESSGQAFESLTARHFVIHGAMGEWLKPHPC